MKWPRVHHPDPNIQIKYQTICQKRFFDNNIGVDRDYPKIDILENGYYVIHQAEELVQQSAWNSIKIIKNVGPNSGWIDPKEKVPDLILTGNYVGFCSWFQGNFGHMIHDNLPYIAWLKKELSEEYKFLIFDHPVSRDIIKSFDMEFYERIFWIKKNKIVSIKGNLLVTTPDMHPCIMSAKLINYLTKWLAEKLPKPPDNRNVIYYNRSTDTSYRVLNSKNNKDVISLISNHMEKKGIKGELILFNAANSDGNKMRVSNQIEIFRTAHTIIGPHGSGLANILWSDVVGEIPIKFLEFIPGEEGYSAQVQHEFNGYHNVMSGLPLEYHCVLYEPKSTHTETFVNLSHINMALDDMWPSEIKVNYKLF